MEIQFFVGMNTEVNQPASFSDSTQSYLERTQQQLFQQLQLLTGMVQRAAEYADATHLAIVCCGEDFFQGGKLATAAEVATRSAKCMDRDAAYHFFANTLVQLSQAYPAVLIAPGSVYVGVDAAPSESIYSQDAARKGTHFVQAIAPVLFGGQLIALVKKGGLLWDKNTGQLVGSSAAHADARQQGHRFNVPHYAEDGLADLNEGLIFLGETPLPGEEQLLQALGIDPAIANPVFCVNGVRVGLEICHDHSWKGFNTTNLDIHLVTSHGIGYIYDATYGNGYRLQVDAESTNLTTLTCHEEWNRQPLNAVQLWINWQEIWLCESQSLRLVRAQHALNALHRLLKPYTERAKSPYSQVFHKPATHMMDALLQEVVQMKRGNVTLAKGVDVLAKHTARLPANHPVSVGLSNFNDVLQRGEAKPSRVAIRP